MKNAKMKIAVSLVLAVAALPAFAYSGGSGTAGDPYQIATKADLLALAAATTDYNKYFILTADIDMAGEVFTMAIIAADTSSNHGFQGTAFTGTFDGNGHKITNFTINGGSNNYLGLFGRINSSGLVKNLGLENFAVSGTSGSNYVGGLVGFNYGSISNCYSTGTISGTYNVGGLVGYNDGGSISNCYATGTVSGGSNPDCVGGLVGLNNTGGSISNCYSTGAVSGTNRVGGLAGDNISGGSISNCYSTGTVSGLDEVGGLAGRIGGLIINCYATGMVSGIDSVGGLVGVNGGGIINCYSTGMVSGTSAVGGLVGFRYGGDSSSFWDKDTSGWTTSDGGTGKTTAEMKTLSTFTSAGWDFINVWGIEQNQTYPYLRTRPLADLNYDGAVNFIDFALFAQDWLEGL